ncbi:MAG TPA: reverse transcriptase-like protein [Methanoregulaceae archaeon]|nr:MAG: reverse transcriptase-like protein [Methanolinea sp.]HON82364.1 reverse transcriptase-like protein [Methanoregulaceae archaeon]HPD11168.1 reverse transcriptase-like protein [Methanoregulaceae archaeon]HRT16182.1 reverse transcriptase-like protein [Methanoregulaceae archaeon]HRU31736.1 reverse transcriptase-like protein [Methanoregulaceae archaeon]
MQRDGSEEGRAYDLAALSRAPDALFFKNCPPGTVPGSLLPSPGPGGEPVHDRIEIMVDGSGDGHSIALFPGEEVFFSYERGASNNEAEFNAVILALENLPDNSHARIRTDSQVVVWHLTREERVRHPSFIRKRAMFQDLIVQKNLKVDVQWIPRKQNRADRFLKHYITSLCGAGGTEPLYRRVRRLEHENVWLKARLRQAMKMLERRTAFSPDPAVEMDLSR